LRFDFRFVYILASRIGGTLYIGVTSDLIRRVEEHRARLVPGFTRKYGVTRLVYFESSLDHHKGRTGDQIMGL
jgi:predicted GIY-YIG superfamily endonuclease